MGCEYRLPEGQGTRLSARSVDDATSGPPCASAWSGGGVHLGRFEFTFTPKHGSWLNLVEGFFPKLARSVLRHIRVASKQELKDRIMATMDEFNRNPVVHTWSYKLDQAA
jgi:transposase